jgi:peptide/nickel transport system ATP-binding protein
MLDVSVRAEILELVQNLKDKLKISYLYITHDLATVRNLGDSIAIMYAGKIVEEGDIDKVLLNPLHPYTQALIDAISEPDPNNLNIERQIRIKHGEFVAATHGCKFYNRCLYAMDQCRNNPTLETHEKDHSVSCFIYQRHHQKI